MTSLFTGVDGLGRGEGREWEGGEGVGGRVVDDRGDL